MTAKPRKQRIAYSPAQKLEYAKQMVEDNYTVKQIMEIFGVSISVQK